MASSEYLFNLPAAVLCDFCRLMDALDDTQWVRFASVVLSDQTDLRLAEKRGLRRTDYVMSQWINRNGLVEDLIGLLERQQLLIARDVIRTWSDSRLRPQPSHSLCNPAPTLIHSSLPTSTPTIDISIARPLPKPGPPPPHLKSEDQPPNQAVMMCWSHDEVEKGTNGFSPSQLVGEGGFGDVYQACMRNTEYAVKRLKQDPSLLDWSKVKKSFKTEMEKLSEYKHPNVLELMGFSVGVETFCLLSSFMSNGSLESQLASGSLSLEQRVCVAEGASRALKFLHFPPPPHPPLIHGDVKSSNILLDQHLLPKLGDFGLTVFSPARGVRTSCVGMTASLRRTQAYLPQDYHITPSLDVYSFGVVLLEVLTGHRAVETEGSRAIYLKDLPALLEEAPSLAQGCAIHLDARLRHHNTSSPGGVTGCVEVAALACKCLHKIGKKRPAITEVLEELEYLLNLLRGSPSPPPSLRSHPPPMPTQDEVRLGTLVRDMAQLGIQGHSSCSSISSISSISSSASSSSTFTSSSLSQPCESDESASASYPSPPTKNPQPSSASQHGATSSCSAASREMRPHPASQPLPHHHPTEESSPGTFLPSLQPHSSPIQTGEDLYSACCGPEESDELDFHPN